LQNISKTLAFIITDFSVKMPKKLNQETSWCYDKNIKEDQWVQSGTEQAIPAPEARSIFSTPWAHSQDRINHCANRANTRGLTLLGAPRLNIKTLLYCFFMFPAVHHASKL